MDEAYVRAALSLKSYNDSGRLYLSSEERRMQTENNENFRRAKQCLDLSGVSPVLRDVVSIERILQLKEIFDRIEIPLMQDDEDSQTFFQISANHWRIANTEIEITLLEEGPRAGEYLISAKTIELLPNFYERVHHLPYKPGPAKDLKEIYQQVSLGRTDTIYQAFASSPVALSNLVPSRWIIQMPAWARERILGVTLWQWLSLGLALLVSVFVFIFARFVGRLLPKLSQDRIGRRWQNLLTPIVIVILSAAFSTVASAVLRIGGSPLVVISFANTVIFYLAAAWVSLSASSILAETVVVSQQLR